MWYCRIWGHYSRPFLRSYYPVTWLTTQREKSYILEIGQENKNKELLFFSSGSIAVNIWNKNISSHLELVACYLLARRNSLVAVKVEVFSALRRGMLVGWGEPRGSFQLKPMILWGFIAKSGLEMALDVSLAWKNTATVVCLSVCAHVKMGILFLLQLVNVLATCTWGIMTLVMDTTCSRMHTKSLLETKAF